VKLNPPEMPPRHVQGKKLYLYPLQYTQAFFFIADPIKYAATPPNQPQRCILTDYSNNYNFSKLR
jgi:hypothetical protein